MADHQSQTVAQKAPPKKKGASGLLYILVFVGMAAGVIVGLVAPGTGLQLKPLGTLFVNLVQMMIAPIIFCTIVLGIGSVKKAATVGRTGGVALIYFLIMSTIALIVGLVVGNIVQPGSGLAVPPGGPDIPAPGAEESGPFGFVLSMIPVSLVSAMTDGVVLQILLVALLVGFALQGMGERGEPLVELIGLTQKLVFRVLALVLWVAPIGAFGGMAAFVGGSGVAALGELVKLILGFYVSCLFFIFVILGTVLWLIARVNVFTLLKYLTREFLLIVATSNSETALPNLMAKLEHAGIQRSTVGIVVPTGYSFNLDGSAIYLTMTALFVAEALNKPMTIGEQIGLLLFMMLASKGAAGVSGAGLATLSAGLSSHRPDLVEGISVVTGIDRFMSEGRGLTNYAGNTIATVIVAALTRTMDREQLDRALKGRDPFDYTSMDA